MRSIADKIKALIMLPFRSWRQIAPEMPNGTVPKIKYVFGFYRTQAAPRWRTVVRASTVLFGFALFFALQISLAYGITQIDVNPMAWVLITAFFIITISLTLASTKPTFAFIAWLVLSPLGFIFLRMDFGAGMPAVTFDRIVILALAMILIIRTMANRHQIKTPIVGEWLILAFIGYTVLMVAFSSPNDPIQALGIISERFDHIVLSVIIYYVAKSVLITKEHVKWAVIGFVITGFYVAISAFYEHYTGSRWFSSFLGAQYRLGYGDVGMGRATGPLINPAAAGAFLGITAFLTLHLGTVSRNKFAKFACFCAAGIQLIGCYFTYTRSGYISAILLLCAMPFAARYYRKTYAFCAVAAAIVAIVALPIVLSNADINKRLTQPKTVLIRLVVTHNTISIIRDHPFFGVGLGEIDHALEQYVSNVGTLGGIYARGLYPGISYPQTSLRKVVTSHNSILTIFAEQGMIGGLLFIGSLFALLVHLYKLCVRMPYSGLLGRDFLCLVIVGIIGHIVSTMGYDIRFFKYPSYSLWVLLALGVRLGEIYAKEQSQNDASSTRAELPKEFVNA